MDKRLPRLGDKVRILEADVDVVGRVVAVSLFLGGGQKFLVKCWSEGQSYKEVCRVEELEVVE